jgi:hypothetical protein
MIPVALGEKIHRSVPIPRVSDDADFFQAIVSHRQVRMARMHFFKMDRHAQFFSANRLHVDACGFRQMVKYKLIGRKHVGPPFAAEYKNNQHYQPQTIHRDLFLGNGGARPFLKDSREDMEGPCCYHLDWQQGDRRLCATTEPNHEHAADERNV